MDRLVDLVEAAAERGPADRVEIPLSEATLLKLALDPRMTVRLTDEQAANAREIAARSHSPHS